MLKINVSELKVRTTNGENINVSELANPKPGSFVDIKGYRQKNGTIADYTLNGNINYENAIRTSVEILESFDVSTAKIPEYLSEFTVQELNEIKHDLVLGYVEKLNKTPEEIEEESLYTKIAPGVQYKDGLVYISGLIVPGAKIVREIGYDDRPKKRKSLTLAKEWFRGMVPVNKYRTFVLAGNFDSIKMNKKHLGSKTKKEV